MGEKVKVFTKEGKILIKENPALVTRQLSQLAKENNLYWFKLTSLKYLNPFNKLDYTETKALKLFENSKIREFTEIERVGEHTYYRLIKPLITERECLKCHEKHQVGQIRGAISIFIPCSLLYQWLFLVLAFFLCRCNRAFERLFLLSGRCFQCPHQGISPLCFSFPLSYIPKL